MSKPANPFQFWCEADQKYKLFTFESGDLPFYVRLEDKSCIALSLLIFADNEDHVKSILRRLIDFRIKIQPAEDNRDFEILSMCLNDSVVSSEHTFELSITQINPNQAFKVSWADNGGY